MLYAFEMKLRGLEGKAPIFFVADLVYCMTQNNTKMDT